MNSTQPRQENGVRSAKAASTSAGANGSSGECSKAATASELALESKSVFGPLQPDQVSVGSFIGNMELGIAAWIHAGEILVALLKRDGKKVFNQIQEKCPWITANMLWSFYEIGMKRLSPHVLIVPRNAAVARRIAALPIELQERICSNGLDVVDDDYGTRRKRLAELTLQDVMRGCDGAKLRSVPDQVALIRSLNGKKIEPVYPGKPGSTPITVSRPAAAIALPAPVPADQTITAGAYRCVLDIESGRVTFDRVQGNAPPATWRLFMHPNKGKLECHFELRRPKPF